MTRIDVISASAGTGKTYRLAEQLWLALRDGAARPDAIVATTFTKKAAAELEERVRRRLLEEGLVEEAHRLGASRFGTVNAVCSELVLDFAFELGLSPGLRVLDENLAHQALAQSLAKVVDQTVQDELLELSSRLDGFAWQRSVHQMVDQARSNGLQADDLRAAAARSLSEIEGLLGSPTESAEALDQRLYDALDAFVEKALAIDPRVTNEKAVEKARPLRNRLRAGRHLTWYDWSRLANLSANKTVDELIGPLRAAAAAHDVHPRLLDDCRRAIEHVHELAARSLEAYQAYKRTWGVVDFPDQEVYALQLLDREDVRERLNDELDLVLVDEFQDTSPIQLAIFLRLAEVAKRSVWVGDPKQAIFGFRGTDPALLDTVLEHLSGTSEVLSTQYRSRPLLVELTSRLFAQAFERHGVAAENVWVAPHRDTEAPGLGQVLEYWRLKSGNAQHDAAAVSTLIEELLADETVRVRDPESGAVRRPRPGDIAVLCRYNRLCDRLADALEARDIGVVLPRQGLLKTPEGLVALAALQLFVDPRDGLARARLSRFLTHVDDPDAWLDELLSAPKGSAFDELPAVGALLGARGRLQTAGAVSALDAVVEAIDLAGLCRGWGNTAQRLANVDRLRAHAVDYAAHCEATGAGCTPAGLAAHLQSLAQADNPLDQQAMPRSSDAVNVLTWHRAKGLEWPIVVLFPHNLRGESALGVQIVNEQQDFDLHDPLAHRWLRFWPNPYQRQWQSGPGRHWGGPPRTPFRDRLEEAASTQRIRATGERQTLRLLYVGWTRARDRLILATRPQKLLKGILSRLVGPDGPLLDPPTAFARWGGMKVEVRHREGGPLAPKERTPRPGTGLAAGPSSEHAPARLTPSAMDRWGPAGQPERLGSRLRVRSGADMLAIGEALHGFLAADLNGLPEAERTAAAAELIARWRMSDHIEPETLLEASRRLTDWLERRWPGAQLRCEWSIRHRLDSGTIVHGFADLVVLLPHGFAVIDHKSFVGGSRQSRRQAAQHSGQLAAYATAVEAALDKRPLGCFVHFPLGGFIYRLLPSQLSLAL